MSSRDKDPAGSGKERRQPDAIQAHTETCEDYRAELEKLRAVVESFASGPNDLLRPADSLWDRLAERISAEGGTAPLPVADLRYRDSEWEDVAPGISCRLLATDKERDRVSMLVRLAPGVHYPPHRHAGVEELHLLSGELWIDDRKLCPGDYNRGEPGASDKHVWSETGCTCVLITSYRDRLIGAAG